MGGENVADILESEMRSRSLAVIKRAMINNRDGIVRVRHMCYLVDPLDTSSGVL